MKVLIQPPSGWFLLIEPDGGGAIALGNENDSSAVVPAGTFDVAAVRDRLLAASSDTDDPDYSTTVFFLRSGQYATNGYWIQDRRLIEEYFAHALAAATNPGPAFERLRRERPVWG